MKMLVTLAAAALMALPVSAAAESLSGALTFGFGRGDVSGTSAKLTSKSFDGRIASMIGSNVSFGLRANAANLRLSGYSGHVSGQLFGVTGAYHFAENLSLGAYVERASIDATGLVGTYSATSYGLTGGYASRNFKVNAFFGRSTTDPALPAGVNLNSYGVYGHYGVGSKWMVGGHAIRTHVSSGVASLDADSIGLAGAYAVSDSVTLFGGVTRAKLDGVGLSSTDYGFGVSYNIGGHTGLDSTLSLELARSRGDVLGYSGSIDTIRIGWTVPMGRSTGKVPLNSLADAILVPAHGALTTSILSAF